MPDPRFTGSGVALVTPFDAGGINESVLRELVRFHLREGTGALVVNGSTGEAATMSPDEQRRAVEIVADETGGELPVIAGAGGSDTAVVSQIARNARDAGADALLVAPPPYNKPTQQGMIAHFRAVLDAADLPAILYNVPGRTACNLLPATVAELAGDDARVIGVKEASGDISQVAELARLVGNRVAIYSGNDEHIVPVLSLGGRGVISVLANIAPGDVARLVRLFLGGETREACALQLRFLPLIGSLFREPNPSPIKAAMEMLGFGVGSVRLPLLDATPSLRGELGRLMGEAGLA